MTIYQRLLDEGPLALTHMSLLNKQKGVAKFTAGGKCVWYIVDEHSCEEVIQAWLDVNDHDGTTWSVYQRVVRQGPQWQKAAKDVFDVTRKVPGGRSLPKKDCPLCGLEDITHLAKHLPKCPER